MYQYNICRIYTSAYPELNQNKMTEKRKEKECKRERLFRFMQQQFRNQQSGQSERETNETKRIVSFLIESKR